ncbi:MAG: DUF1330 domain-containing protein [Pseudomonadota bacterium]
MRAFLGISLLALIAGCSSVSRVSDEAGANACDPAAAPALLVVVGDNLNPDQYRAYGEALAAAGLYERLEGYYLALGDPDRVLEGEWPEPRFQVLARFPCLAAVEAFWYSSEYEEIKKLRTGAGAVVAAAFEERSVPERVRWLRPER